MLSDIHLGSEVARPTEAMETLEKYRFNRLILLGDIFDDLNFNRLEREHWSFLSYIRKLSNPKNNIEVVWVEGNHDEGLSKITSHFIGIKVYKEYSFRIKDKNILAIHGHQFDRFLNENVVISNIAAFIYEKIQKIGGEKQTIARWIKGKSKGWLRLSKKISIRASEYAANKGFNTVVCGHTHDPMDSYIKAKNIQFYNTGCWTDIPSSYIIISTTGEFTIKYDPA
ncbi:MAG: metallophosphoesterase family protein [Ignavibacteria bacterium]